MLTNAGLIVLFLVAAIVTFVLTRNNMQTPRSFDRSELKRLAAYRRFAADIQELSIEHADVYGEMSMYINDKLKKLNRELEQIT